MTIYAAYIGYVAATITIFVLRPARQAALMATMLGWLLLPVAVYPSGEILGEGLTMEIIGIALPSRLLLTKALVVATTVFLCLAIRAPGLFGQLRLALADVALGLFCLTPLLAAVAGKIPVSQGFIQAAYLAGVWGCTWLTGRLVLSDPDGQRDLARAIVASGLFLLVPAVLESMRPAWLYVAFYGPHAFAFDGVSRYVGFRPLAFFEHGNQYGMWISMAALVAVHGVLCRHARSKGHVAVAVALTVCAIASQSVGAILLAIGGGLFLHVPLRLQRAAIMATGLLVMTAGTAYLSGKVPLRSWALETPSGQLVTRALHATGRGSLGWRVQRDQKALQLIGQAPLVGYGTWDWWRPVESHPWGLPLLIAGQFGVLALVLAALALLLAPLRDIWRGSGSVLPIVVITAMLDAWLNSTIYMTAILASAALAVPIARGATRAAGPPSDREASHGR